MNYLQSISLSVFLISFVAVCASIAYFFIRVASRNESSYINKKKVKRKFVFNEVLVYEFLRAYRGQKPKQCKELLGVNFAGLSINEKMNLFISAIDRAGETYNKKPISKDFSLSKEEVIQFVKAICGHRNNYGVKREEFANLTKIEQVRYFNEIIKDENAK